MKTSKFNSRQFPRVLALVALFFFTVSTAKAFTPGDSLLNLIKLTEYTFCGLQNLSTIVCEPQREFTRTISREFATLANGMTALYNRHGKVNVKTWKDNKVKIDVLIVINATDQKDADQIFQKINVNFTSTSGYIKAETMIGDLNSNWGRAECKDFKINYDVWMPVGNQLDLRNKYGNSFVGQLNGKLTADIRYGDLLTEAIGADADILIEYGKATLASTYNLYGQVGYGGIYVNQANDIQLDTRNSACTFRSANNVRLTSRYDDLDLGIVKDLRIQTKYSDLEVKSVQAAYVTAQYTNVHCMYVGNQVDADLSYGGLQVDNLSKNFSVANVVGTYTDVDVKLERNTAFKFDITGNYTDIRFPQGVSTPHASNTSYAGGGRKVYRGHTGAESAAKGIIKGQMNAGSYRISYQ